MQAQTEEQLNKLPEDYRVWVVIDKNDQDRYLLFPGTIDEVMGLFAFIEERDAKHMVRLLKKYAEQYSGLDLDISHDLLSDLRNGARAYNCPLWVLDNRAAMDFFTRYPDSLDEY
jgi:hypothetical protein